MQGSGSTCRGQAVSLSGMGVEPDLRSSSCSPMPELQNPLLLFNLFMDFLLLRHFQWISSMEYVTCRLQNRASPEDFSLSDSPGPYAWLPRTNYSTLPGMLLSIRPSNDLGCLPRAALPFALPAPSAPTVRALSWPLCPSPTDTTISNLCAPASRYVPYKYPGAL